MECHRVRRNKVEWSKEGYERRRPQNRHAGEEKDYVTGIGFLVHKNSANSVLGCAPTKYKAVKHINNTGQCPNKSI